MLSSGWGFRKCWFVVSCLTLLACDLLFSGTVSAQESLRMSLAGAEAARARREAGSRTDLYDLHLGPTWWAFGAGLGVDFSDNLRGTAVNQETDASFRPEIDTQMRWPVSDVNTLNLSVGAGYVFYVMHPEYDRPFITPGSELSFDIYAGDFWINVHDRFSIQENGYLDPTVTGIGDYERLDNAAGLSVTWDLNKIIAKVGYDHVNYMALGEFRSLPDAQLEVFSSSAAWLIRPGIMAGVDGGATLVKYIGLGDSLYYRLYYSDGTQWNVGAFYEAQISEYISGRASLGYSVFTPETGLAALTRGEFNGVYAQLSARHRLNQYVDYSLNGGRLLNFAYYGGMLDQYFAGIDARWHFVRKTGLVTSFNYQHGSNGGIGLEKFDWFGPSISLERQITAKLTATLAYHFYWRGSNLPNRDYTANVVSLRAVYRF